MDINKFHLCDVADGLKTLESESADIIILDPPYNCGKDFGENKDNLEIEEYIKWIKTWLNESIRILKPTGSMFIYGFSEILAHISVNLTLKKRWLIWHYTNKTVPSYQGWQRSHESIIYAWKDKPIFNTDAVRIPYTDTFLKAVGKKRTKSETARYGSSDETFYTAHENGAMPRDVFTDISALAGGAGKKERYFLYKDEVYPAKDIKNFPIDECLKHPTQKPFKLTERLILSSKPEKCFVVIPFAGSGSEGVVCKKLGCDFIGFDNNPDYIKLANGALKLDF